MPLNMPKQAAKLREK